MKKGHDYIGVGVGAVIRDSQGRLLLARRGPWARNEQYAWEFPGGAVEFGERLEDALRREIREEFGIEISVDSLLDVVDHILPNEGQHWISPTFICTIISGEPGVREPDKCLEIGWFGLDDMPENLSQVTRVNLKHYRQYINSEQ